MGSPALPTGAALTCGDRVNRTIPRAGLQSCCDVSRSGCTLGRRPRGIGSAQKRQTDTTHTIIPLIVGVGWVALVVRFYFLKRSLLNRTGLWPVRPMHPH